MGWNRHLNTNSSLDALFPALSYATALIVRFPQRTSFHSQVKGAASSVPFNFPSTKKSTWWIPD